MKNKNIQFLIIILLITLLILGTRTKKQIPVSFPEEIEAIQKNDKLVVLSISDSIYLGFNNSKK